jgi:hypothetical protein
MGTNAADRLGDREQIDALGPLTALRTSSRSSMRRTARAAGTDAFRVA